MKQLVIVIIALICTLQGIAADDAYNAWWQKGIASYQQKEYESAAQYFEKLASKHPADAAVYYNLGNTYYRLNRIGLAVLNYERALRFRPGYKDAQDNLSLTQSRISNRIQANDDIFFVQWWKALTSASKANIWAVLSLVVFLAWIGMQIARRLGRFAGLPVQANAAIITVCALLLVLAFTSAMRRADSGHAIVMEENAALMADPAGGKQLSLIPEGTKVQLEEVSSGWIEVQLPDGRIGWMQKKNLANI